MRIESGPTGERKVRTTLLLLMVAVFSAWFAYDGWVHYPALNIKEHLDQLAPEEREQVGQIQINPLVIEETAETVRTAVAKAAAAERRAVLENHYHGPPSFVNDEGWYYFGPAFRVRVVLKDGEPSDTVITRPTSKTATSIRWQKYLAVGLAALSIYLVRFVLRVRRTRLVLDENGIVYQGKGPIGWADMRELLTSRFKDKGFVDLVYDDHGTSRKLRLDEYHIAKFDEVIELLCERKAFENPLPVSSASPAS